MGSIRRVELEWTGSGISFIGGGTEPPSPRITVDGDGADGPSPMHLLLLAAGACSGIDIVMILEKMRVTIDRFTMEVVGERVDDDPRRYRSIKLIFRLSGDGLDRSKAERAAALSVEKYCSVVHSLDPGMSLEHEVEVS